MRKEDSEWFSSWFDTKYYHILYKHRDHKEAHAFMDTLTEYLNLPEMGSVLDLACGKGRHAKYLNSLGYHVTGVDLSENSIAYAKQFENESLNFEVHDMREVYPKQFDAVFNLFTSFGYFDNDADNLKTIKAIKAEINEYGFAVIDFLNSEYVINNLVPEEIKTIDGIDFNLKRYVEGGYIIKDISFNADGKTQHYQERVRALTLQDFELIFAQAGVHLIDIFGDYKLHKFNPKTSERLVMVFK